MVSSSSRARLTARTRSSTDRADTVPTGSIAWLPVLLCHCRRRRSGSPTDRWAPACGRPSLALRARRLISLPRTPPPRQEPTPRPHVPQPGLPSVPELASQVVRRQRVQVVLGEVVGQGGTKRDVAGQPE